MHIYVFGSVARGEVDLGSDIDLLSIVEGYDSRFNPAEYSIYSYSRIKDLWQKGSPFAWHLFLEAKLIYSSDGKDFLFDLGKPAIYKEVASDCQKFYEIFSSACDSLIESSFCDVFDLSSIFLGIRNFATCYSLAFSGTPDFSRHSAQKIGDKSIQIDDKAYNILERSRILCTRGTGDRLTIDDVSIVKKSIIEINNWMMSLLEAIK